MGPVELTFFAVLAVFGAIGLVRGQWKELGVTTMLMLVLFAMEVISEQFASQVQAFLGFFVGPDPQAQAGALAVIYSVTLIIVAFISYEGETLAFLPRNKNWFFSLGAGLLSGWLLAGSIWYYLQAAGWPVLRVSGPFSALYNALVPLLPPALLTWWMFAGLAILLLIARVWK